MEAPINVEEGQRLVFLRGVTQAKKASVRHFLGSIGAFDEQFASGKKSVMLVKFEKPESAERVLKLLADPAALSSFLETFERRKDLEGVIGARGIPRELPAGLDVATERIRHEWKKEQNGLRTKVKEVDDFNWKINGGNKLRLIGGMDISFVKENNVDACAALVVLDFTTLKVIYEDYQMVKLTQPYIPGFLAFREVPHLLALLETLRRRRPDLLPQVIFMDGNGVLHPRACGVASHFGVLADIPTLGIAKTLMYVDGLSIENVKPQFRQRCLHAGDSMELRGESGRLWGAAFKSSEDSSNPVFVSVGHRISLPTAVEITRLTSKVRIPEAVRQADLRSRNYIRNNHVSP